MYTLIDLGTQPGIILLFTAALFLASLAAVGLALWEDRAHRAAVAALTLPFVVSGGVSAIILNHRGAEGIWFHPMDVGGLVAALVLLGLGGTSFAAGGMAVTTGASVLLRGGDTRPSPKRAAWASVLLLSTAGIGTWISGWVAVSVGLAGLGNLFAGLHVADHQRRARSRTAWLAFVSVTLAVASFAGGVLLEDWNRTTFCELEGVSPGWEGGLAIVVVLLTASGVTADWRRWTVELGALLCGLVGLGVVAVLPLPPSLETEVARHPELPVVGCAMGSPLEGFVYQRGEDPHPRCGTGRYRHRLTWPDEPLHPPDPQYMNRSIVRRPDGTVGSVHNRPREWRRPLSVKISGPSAVVAFLKQPVAVVELDQLSDTLSQLDRITFTGGFAVEFDIGQTTREVLGPVAHLDPDRVGRCALTPSSPHDAPRDLLRDVDEWVPKHLDAQTRFTLHHHTRDCPSGTHAIDLTVTDTGVTVHEAPPCARQALQDADWQSFRGRLSQPIVTW